MNDEQESISEQESFYRFVKAKFEIGQTSHISYDDLHTLATLFYEYLIHPESKASIRFTLFSELERTREMCLAHNLEGRAQVKQVKLATPFL